jgi:hypothetical protein
LAYCLANQGANKSDIVNMFEFGGNRAGYAAIIPIGLVCVRIAYGRAMSVGQTVEFVSGQFLHLCAVIERAVILSNHGVLSNPLPVAAAQTVAISPAATTLRDSERAVILQTLEAAGWAVGGPKRRSGQTWPEAHYADLQDAEAGDFPAGSPKQPGSDGIGTAGANLAPAIAVKIGVQKTEVCSATRFVEAGITGRHGNGSFD